MRITDNEIIWSSDDFLGGFVPVQGNYYRTVGTGLANMQNVDPFTTPGILNAGPAPVTVTNTTTGLPSAVQIDATTDLNGTYGYTVGGTKMNRYDISASNLTDTGVWPHTLAAAGIHSGHTNLTFAGKGSTAFYYQTATVGAVSNRVFYAWTDDTDWDVGMYNPTNDAFVDDFMTGGTTGASTAVITPLTNSTIAYLTSGQSKIHPVYVARANDIKYIGSGNFVHQYDGTTNTFSPAVLTLPVGYEVVGFAETSTDLLIFATTARGTTSRGKAAVFFWDNGRPTNYYKNLPLTDDDVSCPFTFGTTIGCFTQSRNATPQGTGNSVLRIYDGTEFKPVFFWSGTLPVLGGADITNGMINWNSDGKIYRYGSFNGQLPVGTFQTQSGQGSSSGILKSFKGGALITSSGSGTTGGLDSFSGFAGDATFNTLSAVPDFPVHQYGKISSVQIILAFNGTSTAGRQLTVNLVQENAVAYPVITSMSTFNSTATQSNAIIFIDYKNFSDTTKPTFSSLRASVAWAGGNSTSAIPIKEIRVRYEKIDYPAQTIT